MNRKERYNLAQKELRKPVTPFEAIDLTTTHAPVPKGMTRAFRNTRYTVMIYDNTIVSTGFAIKALVQRHDANPIPLHWSEMQKIKNEIFGKEITAVEYYPAESKLVNEKNIYWMWIFPEGVLPITII